MKETVGAFFASASRERVTMELVWARWLIMGMLKHWRLVVSMGPSYPAAYIVITRLREPEGAAHRRGRRLLHTINIFLVDEKRREERGDGTSEAEISREQLTLRSDCENMLPSKQPDEDLPKSWYSQAKCQYSYTRY